MYCMFVQTPFKSALLLELISTPMSVAELS